MKFNKPVVFRTAMASMFIVGLMFNLLAEDAAASPPVDVAEPTQEIVINIEQDETSDEPMATLVNEPVAVAEETVDQGLYPNNPFALEDMNKGQLAPYSDQWYKFTYTELDDDLIENMSLAMFYTPGEGNILNKVNFEIYPSASFHIWDRGTADEMRNLGAGALVQRDGDDLTGERLWHGTVVDGDSYFVKIENAASIPVDYYLMIGDIVNTELGEPTLTQVSQEPVVPGSGISSALTAKHGLNSGKVKAGEQVWYALRAPGSASVEFFQHHYTMVLEHTPGEGNVANYVDLEIYPYPDHMLWARGTENLMVPMGSGLRAEYDQASDVQTRIWDGYLTSDTIFFVCVRNASEHDISFDLDIQLK